MTLSTYICLCGFLACLAALAAMKARHICRDVWRSFAGRRGAFAALAAFAVVATICAQKPNPPVITVDSFLADAGSYATNDVLHVAVTNAPAYATVDFSSCPVLVYARPRGLSDAPEWEELLPRRTFSELPADYAIEDATNYNYLVYLDYVPPSPVHTNGVFELRGFVVPDDEPGNLEQLAAGFATSTIVDNREIVPIEYLESTGTQWIDTGYAFQDNFAWELTFNGLGYDQTLFGGRTTAARSSLLYQRHKSVGEQTTIPIAGYNGTTTPFVLANLKSGLHTVKAAFAANKGSVCVDGVARYTSRSFSGNYISGVSHVVFADNYGNGDVREFANSKVYALKMWQNGVLVRDYIPVRVGTTGAMYDKRGVGGMNPDGKARNDGLYFNRGTGAFIPGPDIKE